MFTGYKERNEILAELGFLSYQDYLDSELWKVIRKHILDRDYYYCRGKLCNQRTNVVHHFTYNRPTLLGLSPYTLITLCRDCHKKVEYANGEKRNLRDVQRATLELVTGTRIEKGISNPKIGWWFKNQFQMNVPIRDAIQKELKEIKYVSLSNL